MVVNDGDCDNCGVYDVDGGGCYKVVVVQLWGSGGNGHGDICSASFGMVTGNGGN